MADKDAASPATTSMAYDVMSPRWALIETLLGGTESMRSAGEAFLPRHSEEDVASYAARLETSVLLNMTELTLDTLVSKPFGEAIKLNEDVPQVIVDLLEDVDLQGNNIDVFCRKWFKQGVAKAFAHILVEYPRTTPPAEGQVRTLEDDRREKVRPYWVHVAPENVIFAYYQMIDGQEIPVHVRIRECEIQMSGFAEVVKERIRVLEPGSVKVYEKKEKKVAGKDEWFLLEEYATGADYIPLVTFYVSKQDACLGKPPLTDLAHLNVAHWQSSSDQRNVLTVARFPMLAVSGGGEEADKLRVGPKQWLATSDAKGKFYYVEHSGAAIAAGQVDIESLEAQMSNYGAEFLKEKPGGETATAKALDSAESMSSLQAWVIDFEDAIAQALWFTAKWLNQEDGGTVELLKDYGTREINHLDLDSLDKARGRHDISRKTYLNELRLRGVLNEDFDAEEDLEEIMDEAPQLGGGSFIDLDPAQMGAAPPPGTPAEKPVAKPPAKK
jgi:hypothetical protein